MTLHGQSLIAGTASSAGGVQFFQAVNPADRSLLEPPFLEAGEAGVHEAMRAAEAAWAPFMAAGREVRASFLEKIAEEILELGEELLLRASAESGLPLDRLTGERGRTCGQLRMFAGLVREGSWVDARIDPAMPERLPLPRPDLRRMLVPLGPVVVLGASNFPLAFSVAGGDTASAFAAGCPVVVKAHPAHPGTSELVAGCIVRAAQETGLPSGVFSMLHGTGATVAQALVRHPLTRALGFTGSLRAGRALFDAAAARREPIPVFAEMGSLNPIFLLPGAVRERGAQIAAGLKTSVTTGSGQFCTKPGLVFAVGGPELDALAAEFRAQIAAAPCATMLHPGICDAYYAGVERLRAIPGVVVLGEADADADLAKTQGEPVVFVTDVETFLREEQLREEVFGPCTLLVTARDAADLVLAAEALPGSLTGTLHAAAGELAEHALLRTALERRVGRLVLNGFPTGVEVGPTMQHGGPYPATTDARFTSVGTAAILRWARPFTWQACPQEVLPAELRDGNPLGIWRTVNGVLTRDA